jgi:hypothetical protein
MLLFSIGVSDAFLKGMRVGVLERCEVEANRRLRKTAARSAPRSRSPSSAVKP